MSRNPRKPIEDMSIEELEAERARIREDLCDLKETHDFTFGRTTVHIGAERAQAMQEELEEECRVSNEQIAAIEALLRAKCGQKGTPERNGI